MNNTLKNQREYGPKNANMCSTNIQNGIKADLQKMLLEIMYSNYLLIMDLM